MTVIALDVTLVRCVTALTALILWFCFSLQSHHCDPYHSKTTGKISAQEMYQCSMETESDAWAAHGFTDSDMNMGLQGNY